MIVVHPMWVARAGVGDIVRHFDTRGFDVSNAVGSRFFAITAKPDVVPLGAPIRQRGFAVTNFFRGDRR